MRLTGVLEKWNGRYGFIRIEPFKLKFFLHKKHLKDKVSRRGELIAFTPFFTEGAEHVEAHDARSLWEQNRRTILDIIRGKANTRDLLREEP